MVATPVEAAPLFLPPWWMKPFIVTADIFGGVVLRAQQCLFPVRDKTGRIVPVNGVLQESRALSDAAEAQAKARRSSDTSATRLASSESCSFPWSPGNASAEPADPYSAPRQATASPAATGGTPSIGGASGGSRIYAGRRKSRGSVRSGSNGVSPAGSRRLGAGDGSLTGPDYASGSLSTAELAGAMLRQTSPSPHTPARVSRRSLIFTPSADALGDATGVISSPVLGGMAGGSRSLSPAPSLTPRTTPQAVGSSNSRTNMRLPPLSRRSLDGPGGSVSAKNRSSCSPHPAPIRTPSGASSRWVASVSASGQYTPNDRPSRASTPTPGATASAPSPGGSVDSEGLRTKNRRLSMGSVSRRTFTPGCPGQGQGQAGASPSHIVDESFPLNEASR